LIRLKRHWTPQQADNWTKEDWIAIFLSPLAYFLIALGVAGSLLMQLWGLVTLVFGIASITIMYYVIDPKLKKISSEYEKRQKAYLLELEKQARWEGSDG
jgi:hypothetical protein